MKVTIYHNSNCSKSRATLELLNKNNITPTIINYLESPPNKDELKQILDTLGKRPIDIIRFKEAIAKELNISKNDQRELDEWLDMMMAHPILIERPIVLAGDKAVIGRPPENVLALITDRSS